MIQELFKNKIMSSFITLISDSKELKERHWFITETIFIEKERRFICMLADKETGCMVKCVFPFICVTLEEDDIYRILVANIDGLIKRISSMKKKEYKQLLNNKFKVTAKDCVTRYDKTIDNIDIFKWVIPGAKDV